MKISISLIKKQEENIPCLHLIQGKSEKDKSFSCHPALSQTENFPASPNFQALEKARISAEEFYNYCKKNKYSKICVQNISWAHKAYTLAFVEGLMYYAYSFLKYKTKEKPFTLNEICIIDSKVKSDDIHFLEVSQAMVFQIRDWVNEPFSTLDTSFFVKQIKNLAKESKLKFKVLSELDICKEKMGGILGVNKGSIDAPAFTILEWKPKKALNKTPIVLIGKGIVFDSGGMNIKTEEYMNDMKSDMAGAAVASCVIAAAAKLNLPLHIISLCPITDNRLNGNALVPGDIITMPNGLNVEIENTDAEGRLILADAFTYASSFKPLLQISIATLTGAASRAIGPYGIPTMQERADAYLPYLSEAGNSCYERIVPFPMWSEYDKELESKIADIKNCGSSQAGMITAAKFLSHFTTYPFIHLDIAGVAFITKKDHYRGQQATGVSARLLLHFLMNFNIQK